MISHKPPTGTGGLLDGGRELSQIEQKSPEAGSLFRKLIKAVNEMGNSMQISPSGEVPAPKPPDSVSVKVSGEMMHVSIAHSGELNRNIHYFTEVSTSPSFAQPIVIHHGASRTSHPFSLPTKDDNGNPVSYYVRSFAQYPGSQPSAPTIAGGLSSPKAYTMAGTTQMTMLPSNGSGTAATSGQQGGWGLGKTQKRQA